MFIPASTDAPVYHFPAATIGLIVTNVLAFLLTGVARRPDLVDPWILWFGELHVYQWFTAVFMHGGWSMPGGCFYLIVNMVFLWAFGLVVEGKLGWWKFLLLFFLAGSLQFGIEQAISLGSDREVARKEQVERLGLNRVIDDVLDVNFATEDLTKQELEFLTWRHHEKVKAILKKRPVLFGSFGTSGAIYCLLALSLIWAPRNDISVVGFIGLRPFSFEVPIMWFAAIYVTFDALVATVNDFSLSSSMLHIVGAIAGAIAGVVMFKMNAVDCEDWDIFSVLSGNYGPHVRDRYGYRKKEGNKTHDEGPEPKREPKVTENKTRLSKLDEVNKLIDEGDFIEAAEELFSHRIKHPRAKLDEEHLQELCMGLVAERQFEDAEPLLEEYIEQYSDDANWACIRLAAIQLQHNGQPRAAYRTLQQVNRELLTDREKDLGRKLSQAAKKQIEAGVEDKEHEF